MLTVPLRTPLTGLPAEHHAEAVSIFKLVRACPGRLGIVTPALEAGQGALILPTHPRAKAPSHASSLDEVSVRGLATSLHGALGTGLFCSQPSSRQQDVPRDNADRSGLSPKGSLG